MARFTRLTTWAAVALAAGAACSGSHDPAVMEVASADCAVCHTPEYVAATAPPHQDIFPTECALCHTNTAWMPAIFEHGSVTHRPCVLCHQANYDATSDPVHGGMFPTTCEDCHGTNAWRPALSGAHPEQRFPISGGPHERAECTQCHDVDRGPSTDGINTDCVGCHSGEHNMNKVNDQHKEVADYNFDAAMPNFCLVCHPNGRD